jgi:hypothetical protein
MEVLVIMFLAFFQQRPIWLLFYLLCHLLIPRNSVL